MRIHPSKSTVGGVIHWLQTKKRLWPARKKLLLGPARFKKIHQGSLDVSWLAPRLENAQFIFEIGSNSGEDCVKFLEVFPKARVVSFEPDPRAAERWRRVVTSERAELHECVVSNRVGGVEFYQSEGVPPGQEKSALLDDWDLSGSIREPTAHKDLHPWVKFRKPIMVESVTLDSFIDSSGFLSDEKSEIALMWVDVQGAEADVIAGGKKTLERTRYFYTEYSNEELYDGQLGLSNLCKLLPNFAIRRLWKNDVLFENRALI